MTFENWWEDLELMRRLYRYDPESGLIYACDRLPEDFYDTGEGSSFIARLVRLLSTIYSVVVGLLSTGALEQKDLPVII